MMEIGRRQTTGGSNCQQPAMAAGEHAAFEIASLAAVFSMESQRKAGDLIGTII